jgi:hypothetical protein
VTGNYGSHVAIIGADMNLQSSDLVNWTGGYRDIDPYWRFTHSAETLLTKKIDWVFGGSGHLPAQRLTPAPYCNATYSDHCYLQGYWLF